MERGLLPISCNKYILCERQKIRRGKIEPTFIQSYKHVVQKGTKTNNNQREQTEN